MTDKEYSILLLPNVEHDFEYYEKLYPERELPDGAMVTRFAPSPTGFVHIGSLYTSFSDIQLSKQTKGIAYLRIEDTDEKRTINNGIQGIIDDFDSLGIKWDEGPTQGGKYGPYIQSERGDIYRAYARKLIEEGMAYPCFMTEEEIENLKKVQEASKERIGVYGKWAKYRNLPREEVIERVNNGDHYIIRLKSPGNFNNRVVLEDCIKGNIEMPENDLDIVIIKSDDLPTYHFAHPIDDHLMHTTHVIRGDEWVSSYPIHVQLFEILGFKLPKYAHTAPITIREGSTIRKLSKRKDPESAISFYHKLGVPTEVIRLYLATINNSGFEDWYMEHSNLTIDDYNFEFKKMPVGGSLFDINKFFSISKIYFSSLNAEKIYNGLLTYTNEYDLEFYNILVKNKQHSIDVLNIERESEKPRKDISCYKDVRILYWYMFNELFYSNKEKEYQFMKITDYDEINNIVDSYINIYYNQNDDKVSWFNKVKLLCDMLGYASDMKEYKKNPELYKGNIADVSTVIRVVITTKNQTPDLYEIIQVLGKNQILERIDDFKTLYAKKS